LLAPAPHANGSCGAGCETPPPIGPLPVVGLGSPEGLPSPGCLLGPCVAVLSTLGPLPLVGALSPVLLPTPPDTGAGFVSPPLLGSELTPGFPSVGLVALCALAAASSAVPYCGEANPVPASRARRPVTPLAPVISTRVTSTPSTKSLYMDPRRRRVNPPLWSWLIVNLMLFHAPL